jgi:uncharacterized protein
VKAYLDAGGLPNALVHADMPQDHDASFKLAMPLLAALMLKQHSDLPDSITLLVQARAVVDAHFRDSAGSDRIALLPAVGHPCIRPLQTLLKLGADACWRDPSRGATLVHYAASYGQVSRLDLLLKASGLHIDTRDRSAQTPLMWAVGDGKLDTAQRLQQLGAALDAADSKGKTALHYAAANGHLAVAQHLLSSGCAVNACCKEQETPLFHAAAKGSISVAKLLVAHAADVLALNSRGMSALFPAVEGGSVPMLQLLQQAGLSLSAVTSNGTTLLMQAAGTGQVAVAAYLLSQGEPVNAADDCGTTALHNSVSAAGCADMVKLLLAHGADVRAQVAEGATPLDMAGVLGHMHLVKLLLIAGASAERGGLRAAAAAAAARRQGSHEQPVKQQLPRPLHSTDDVH